MIDATLAAVPPRRAVMPRTWRIFVLTGIVALVAWAADRTPAAGALSAAVRLVAGLPWLHVAGLGVVWLLGLCIHSVVLAASLPGLTHRRALALNLSGSAVSNVLPLGGVAGTALNLTMTRTWGHSNFDFARFVVVSKSCDLIAKLVLPGVAVVGLLSCGVVAPATGGAVLVPAGAAFAAGLLVLWALRGRPRPLLRLVSVAARVCDKTVRRGDRQLGGRWQRSVAALLEGTDGLVRRRRVELAGGMAGYWAAQGALLWLCLASFGVHPPPVVVFAALVAERAMTLLALTPGGTGPAEAGTVAVLIALGTDATGSLAAVLLFRAFVFAAEIPVGAVVMAWWWAARQVRIRLGRGSPSDGTPSTCG